jgi:putative flippase GtrA
MRSLIDKSWAWLHTHEGRKIFRYSMVSVITTGVSNLAILIVYGAHIISGEVAATVFGNFVATFPSYWLNRQWAWGKQGRSRLKEIIPFWAVAIAGIAFSMIGAAFVRHLGNKYDIHHLELTVLVVMANIMSFAIFWVLKLLLFNRLFHVPNLMQEIDEELSVEEHSGDNPQDAAVR